MLASRISHVSVRFPQSREGSTWVLVGSDSRADLPTGPKLYGTTADAPGTHADAIVVVHRSSHGTTLLSVPRDTLVSPQPGVTTRLTLTLSEGPQPLVDGLCRTLHIPATHLVIINMKAFAAVINALGGVTITNPVTVRDPYSGLNLQQTGQVHLNGVQSLALVRSRHPETLTASGWVVATSAQGDADRTKWIGAMFRSLATRARGDRWNPITLQSVAWAATGGLTTDKRTGLMALLRLNIHGATPTNLPVQVLGPSGVGAAADAATYQALAASGFTQSCAS
jgi:LCP family protein required for cell wall assembly